MVIFHSFLYVYQRVPSNKPLRSPGSLGSLAAATMALEATARCSLPRPWAAQAWRLGDGWRCHGYHIIIYIYIIIYLIMNILWIYYEYVMNMLWIMNIVYNCVYLYIYIMNISIEWSVRCYDPLTNHFTNSLTQLNRNHGWNFRVHLGFSWWVHAKKTP